MEEKLHHQYLKGFNQGYLLAKYKPKLIEQLTLNTSESEFFQGLKDGEITFEKKQSKKRLKELENLSRCKNKDLGIEK